jgi:hypothetical protein
LPAEVLLNVLEACDIKDFESLMLTCKHIFASGSRLIKDHNHRKRWLASNLILRSSGHWYFGDIWKVFQAVLDEPRYQQVMILSQLDKIEWAKAGNPPAVPGYSREPSELGHEDGELESDDDELEFEDEGEPGLDNGEQHLDNEQSNLGDSGQTKLDGKSSTGEERLKICQEISWIHQRMNLILRRHFQPPENERHDAGFLPLQHHLETLSHFRSWEIAGYYQDEIYDALALLAISNNIRSYAEHGCRLASHLKHPAIRARGSLLSELTACTSHGRQRQAIRTCSHCSIPHASEAQNSHR